MTSGYFIYCNLWIAGFVTCICVYIYMVDHWEGEHIYITPGEIEKHNITILVGFYLSIYFGILQ